MHAADEVVLALENDVALPNQPCRDVAAAINDDTDLDAT
jgi:hypothetical protein